MLSFDSLRGGVHHHDDVIINQDLGVLVSTQNPIRQHHTHFVMLNSKNTALVCFVKIRNIILVKNKVRWTEDTLKLGQVAAC